MGTGFGTGGGCATRGCPKKILRPPSAAAKFFSTPGSIFGKFFHLRGLGVHPGVDFGKNFAAAPPPRGDFAKKKQKVA